MRLRVLGCSGGIGARARTTALLVDTDVLLDAGTGVDDLQVDELAAIDHVFLTHSHLDHIAGLPLMVDSVGAMRGAPVTVHALPETIEALRRHVFNWVIWPDFTEIPDFEHPWLRFSPMRLGETVRLGERAFRALPANHSVPAIALEAACPGGSLVFSGDTGPSEEFWRQVNAIEALRYLIIETAFPNRQSDLAIVSKHLFPLQLAEELARLSRHPEILVTHLKPADWDLITRELDAWAGRFSPRVLERDDIIEL